MESLSQKYQQKTDKQHVLDNPDTYTGTMTMTEIDTFIHEDHIIKSKTVEIIPGLYKLFDEGIVNCRDHAIRTKELDPTSNYQLSYINISINDDGEISFVNDGNGIDIEKHPEYGIWIPEMIFGHLRTSTNYDKSEKKIVGGKNGFGFKLVLIWSTFGEIETVDHIRGLKYNQKFHNNLSIIDPPTITKCKSKPYTMVKFIPDFKRLNIPNLSKDMLSLFKRRIYDIAAVTDKKVKVRYNNEILDVKTFQNYVDLYIGDKSSADRVYELPNDDWEYIVSLKTDEFKQVSFVNGIYTGKGGKHVDYLTNQIIKKIQALIKKRKKIDVKPSTIKEQMFIFLRCNIVNPSFDSQTKDYLSTPVSQFGSSCEVSDKFIDKLGKMGIIDSACALTEVKQNKLAKKTDGNQKKTIRGIPKLIDANFAGTEKSYQCTIILCEGDSAKAGIVSGLSQDDRNYIGVYPMKGKLFNIRGESHKKIMENKEIIEIKQILGLENEMTYTEDNIKTKLRYGKVLFMTDQDLDGSHIKGLGINLIDAEWRSLLTIPNFLGFMNTPILKATKNSETKIFYNDGEILEWKNNNNTNGWKFKYYKGLGTSTSKEFKEYFKNKKVVNFKEIGENGNEVIDMVFNKKRSSDRKKWLENYQSNSYLDTNQHIVTYDDFFTKEMIHFSKYDCSRSIPNMVDGLKTSLRKILYTALKRNLVNEIKVAQFSGSVSEISCYHHGEASLNGAIVGMAQNYVGSNNINLLEPRGQFGTRLQGGSDSASERYIHTCLNPITRLLFPKNDDFILKYLDDDGTLVEPNYYIPIIPLILINGTKGIGTGFSTDILPHNPIDIIKYIQIKLDNKVPNILLKPYFKGFTGQVTQLDETKWLIKGCYQIISKNKILITELPIGTWTDDYKKFLEDLIEKNKKDSPIIKDFNDLSTDTTINITITFQTNIIDVFSQKIIEYECNALEKYLKLYTTKSSSNMHLFDENEQLKKYSNISEIINEYMTIRLNAYQKRKEFIIKNLIHETTILSNKARFIKMNLNGDIDLRFKTKKQVCDLLQDNQFEIIDEDKDFKYLVKLPMDSVTKEKAESLNSEKDNKLKELNIIQETTIKDMWKTELTNLLKINF